MNDIVDTVHLQESVVNEVVLSEIDLRSVSSCINACIVQVYFTMYGRGPSHYFTDITPPIRRLLEEFNSGGHGIRVPSELVSHTVLLKVRDTLGLRLVPTVI